MSGMSSSIGFWSVDPATGALTCCPAAGDMLDISGSHSRMLRDVLLRLYAADRQRLLRAGLGSLKSGATFDIVVLMRMPNGVRLLRVTGGLGYQAEQRVAHLHGVIEQIAIHEPRTFP
jgi:hypothetical protein